MSAMATEISLVCMAPRTLTDSLHTQSKENEVSVEYRWRDASAQVGHTYWYQIGTISAQGIRNNLTGALKKTYSAEAKK